jgi:hypothetical protein
MPSQVREVREQSSGCKTWTSLSSNSSTVRLVSDDRFVGMLVTWFEGCGLGFRVQVRGLSGCS